MSNQLWVPRTVVNALLAHRPGSKRLARCKGDINERRGFSTWLILVAIQDSKDLFAEDGDEFEVVIQDDSHRWWIGYMVKDGSSWKIRDVDGWGAEQDGLACFREANPVTTVRYVMA